MVRWEGQVMGWAHDVHRASAHHSLFFPSSSVNERWWGGRGMHRMGTGWASGCILLKYVCTMIYVVVLVNIGLHKKS